MTNVSEQLSRVGVQSIKIGPLRDLLFGGVADIETVGKNAEGFAARLFQLPPAQLKSLHSAGLTPEACGKALVEGLQKGLDRSETFNDAMVATLSSGGKLPVDSSDMAGSPTQTRVKTHLDLLMSNARDSKKDEVDCFRRDGAVYVVSANIGKDDKKRPCLKIEPNSGDGFTYTVAYICKEGPNPGTILDDKFYGTLPPSMNESARKLLAL